MHVFLTIVGNATKLLQNLCDICVVSVNIKDLSPPLITCPDDIELDADSPLATIATWTNMDFTVDDNVSAVSDISISCTRTSNTLFTIGTTVVTCDATDLVDNTSVGCEFSVIVAGNKPSKQLHLY